MAGDAGFADSGMIALLSVLELVSRENKPVSDLVRAISTRVRSGEINSHVDDAQERLKILTEHFASGEQDWLDGLTVQYKDWWLNVRPSNTEPLLRLNVEGDTRELMEKGRDEALAVIRR